MTLDKFYNPDKYKKDPEENKNLEVVPMYEYYLEMHPLSEVRKKNNRVIIRALKRYELYIRKTKRGQKGFTLYYQSYFFHISSNCRYTYYNSDFRVLCDTL